MSAVDDASASGSALDRWLPPTSRPGLLGDKARLVVLSFLMLFVELALIRWAGSNVVYLSYFSNFVLLGSFLGIGIGFLRAHRGRDLSGWAPVALGLFVVLVRVFPITISQDDPTLFTFSTLTPKGPPREVVLAVVFAFSALVLALIAEGVARTFARFEALDAYTYDLVGSVAGIVAFSALSFLRVPPLGWGIVAAVAFVALWLPRLPSIPQGAALVALIVVLAIESFASGFSWSPYYKIEAIPNPNLGGNLQINVNGVPHQAHQAVENAPGAQLYSAVHPAKLDDVLVIGAGGGNDVAVALAKGAKHVDAVEIDPRLYELGKEHHPNRPYSDPRVTAHIDDGRAFLERTNKRYDLIVLALPDSITLLSGQSALRLESYLFTEEAMTAARDHLTPGGVFAMYNYYHQSWLIDRYGNTLTRVYGVPPCLQTMVPGIGEHGIDLDAFIAGGTPETVDCTAAARARVWAPTAKPPAPATDDHPFPYLRTRTLPALYVVSLALVLVVSLIAVRLTGGPLRKMRAYADLFLMGVAFLLLETKNVVQFALLFGTTWFVNALVFAGVLLSVLAAVAVSKRLTMRRPELLYGVLAASLAVAFFLPPAWLLDLAIVPRFLAAVAVAFAPIFTANLVFTQRFKDTGDSTAAFGANLLGAMVGGVLEYLALITGYRLLLVLVAVLYGGAFVLGRKHLRPA
jgi:spermidine synthase